METISFLWEDESANSLTMARCRKVALRLKNLLEEYGIAALLPLYPLPDAPKMEIPAPKVRGFPFWGIEEK